MRARSLARAVVPTFLVSLILPAQSIVVGLPAIPGEGNCDPFSCAVFFRLTTYQQVYASSAFPGPVTIQSLTFYDTQILNYGNLDQGTYTLSFSYTTKAPGSLDIYNPANNITGTSQIFFSGALPPMTPGPGGTGQLIINGAPYAYDPANGNLLLTIAVSGAKDVYPPLYLDQSQTTAATSDAYFGRVNGGNDPGLITGFTVNGSNIMIPLYGFRASPDGSAPVGGLLLGSDGTLYGTTVHGGASKAGTVFQFTPATWTETVLYSFQGGADGGSPYAGLIRDASGALYGTTAGGGAARAGTVFQLTPPGSAGGAWVKTGLYSFTGGSDGAVPKGGVTSGPNGVLYGATEYGGMGNGTVFQLTPPAAAGGAWTETVLYTFQGGNDGAMPLCNLITDANGNLYGSTSTGGTSGAGTIFELTPPAVAGGLWTKTTLYSFAGGSDGFNPMGRLAMDANGALYGTTHNGGPAGTGTVFSLTPVSGGGWSKATIYSFAGGTDAAGTAVVFGANGILYGSGHDGGSYGKGALFKLSPPGSSGGAWTETVLYSFTGGYDGANPSNVITGNNGVLYGVAQAGGPSAFGSIFEFIP